jgi:uncharacterized protein
MLLGVFNLVCPDMLLTEICNLRCDYCFEKHGKKTLDYDTFDRFAKAKGYINFFPFGGEPLIALDVLEKIIKNTPYYRQKGLRVSNTNGTLVRQNIEKIKELGLELTISCDGFEEVHNTHRKYVNGKGSFKETFDGIMACIENNVKWGIHGVVTKKTLPYLAKVVKWSFDMSYKYKGKKEAIPRMINNKHFIVIEEEWTDEDVDTIIEQFWKIAEWIYTDDRIDKNEKWHLLEQMLNHTGGMCGAGCSLMALDTEMNIYPCHRLATVPEKENYFLGNIYKPEEFKNFKLYNSYKRLKYNTKYMYSCKVNIDNFKEKEKYRWFNWCPSTNLQTSGNIYYQNPKYNVLHYNLLNEMNKILKVYKEK